MPDALPGSLRATRLEGGSTGRLTTRQPCRAFASCVAAAMWWGRSQHACVEGSNDTRRFCLLAAESPVTAGCARRKSHRCTCHGGGRRGRVYRAGDTASLMAGHPAAL